MNSLSPDDYRVLIRISNESLPIGPDSIPEFPNLKSASIRNSVQKLKSLKLIHANEGYYECADDGYKLFDKEKDSLRELYQEWNTGFDRTFIK